MQAGSNETSSPETKPRLTLTGTDGNAFSILGRARRCARKAGWTREQIEKYTDEAKSGDYDNLLAVTMRYFEVD
jgi:hypothetical protein